MSGRDDDDEVEAFEHLYGLGYRLLVPVVPGVGVHPDSDVYVRRGKGPGELDAGGWRGMGGWQKHQASEDDLVRWAAMKAGTGIRTGLQPDGTWLSVLDADTLNPELALSITCEVVRTFGGLPRRVGNAPKALFPVKLSGPLPYLSLRFEDGTEGGGLVEVLGEGKHFVAAGIHPKTERPYAWPDALVPYGELPTFTPADVEAFMRKLATILPKAKGVTRGTFASDVDQDALRGDLALVRRAVAAIPNTREHFPSRVSWLKVGYAIRAAMEDEFEALDLWSEWSARWVDGDNDPEDVVANWGRIKPPFKVGARYLYELADKLGGGNFRAESFHEDAPEPAPEPERFTALFQNGSNEPVISEDEAGIQFAEEHRGKFRFSTSHGRWFVWDGVIWRENTTNLAFHRVREHIRRMASLHPEKVRIAAGRAAFANAVERYARADPAFAVTADAWDRDPWLLGTPGGTVDLRTGELRPARPEDGITRCTAVAPADVADCPLWLHLLDETFAGDPATVRFFRQWAGYSLTGDTREQSLVFGHGEGGNGKGVTINTIGRIAGTYTVTAAAETFVASFGSRHSTELAMLAGARIVKASEMEKGQVWAEKRIKEITGGDEITARFMRQDNFTFLPTFKLIIIGNDIPDLNQVDDAMRRRFNLLPFLHKPARPDPGLIQKLEAEWPAILRWMIDGGLDWQRNGLLRPECVLAATREYFSDQDTMAHWAAESCTIDRDSDDLAEATARLYASWSSYAKGAGVSTGSEKAFARDLRTRFRLRPREKIPLPSGSRVRGFSGIALRAASFHEAA